MCIRDRHFHLFRIILLFCYVTEYISPPGDTRPLLFLVLCCLFFSVLLLLCLCLLCREGGFRDWCGGGRHVTASVLVAPVGEKDVPARQRRLNLPIMLLVPQTAAGASKELCCASVFPSLVCALWTYSHHCQIADKNPSKRWNGELRGFRICIGWISTTRFFVVGFMCSINFILFSCVSFPATTLRATTPHRSLSLEHTARTHSTR